MPVPGHPRAAQDPREIDALPSELPRSSDALAALTCSGKLVGITEHPGANMIFPDARTSMDLVDHPLQWFCEFSIFSDTKSSTHISRKISVTLAGIEEFGFPTVAQDITTITKSKSLMTVFNTKVKSTGELFRDIWLDTARGRAHHHLEWVGQYNLAKAKSAVDPLFLHTNAPSLYMSTDPETSAAIEGASVCPTYIVNPKYSDDFVTKCHGLALALQNTGGVMPYSQTLSELHERSYHLGRECMVHWVQEAFARSILSLSPSAVNVLGPVATQRVNEILRQAKIAAFDRQIEIGLLPLSDPTDSAIFDAVMRLSEEADSQRINVRGRPRPSSLPPNPSSHQLPSIPASTAPFTPSPSNVTSHQTQPMTSLVSSSRTVFAVGPPSILFETLFFSSNTRILFLSTSLL
ncbi:hypothetical protein FA13DRAFT_1794657 [Coprinellus micaceus]|uniref:Uncharacterized protein n=1 Tax=Coprinellus micaceus TaxID=71717 RepID=A0A4Y7T2E8_COPMI|nr:hypothetical protein FA13DRAFT_1794657 [Coprinellus micaceus]